MQLQASSGRALCLAAVRKREAQCCSFEDEQTCPLQVAHKGAGSPSGPIALAASIVRSEGLFGMFRGFWATVVRDAPSTGAPTGCACHSPTNMISTSFISSGRCAASVCVFKGALLPFGQVSTTLRMRRREEQSTQGHGWYGGRIQPESEQCEIASHPLQTPRLAPLAGFWRL